MKHFLLTFLVSIVFFTSGYSQLPSGTIAPAFTVTDLDGNTHDLYSYLNNGVSVVIDVSATWCGPCHAMAPVLQQLAAKVGDNARIIKVDIDKNEQTAAHFQVRAVPTFLLFQNGEVKWRQSGGVPLKTLENEIQKLVVQ